MMLHAQSMLKRIMIGGAILAAAGGARVPRWERAT